MTIINLLQYVNGVMLIYIFTNIWLSELELCDIKQVCLCIKISIIWKIRTNNEINQHLEQTIDMLNNIQTIFKTLQYLFHVYVIQRIKYKECISIIILKHNKKKLILSVSPSIRFSNCERLFDYRRKKKTIRNIPNAVSIKTENTS